MSSWPTEIRLSKDRRTLYVSFDDGVSHALAAELLRVDAVKLTFDDMHDTGIFGWDYLRELGETGEAKMQAYCDALEAQGLSREPLRRR
ncbi:MAG: hypothetical protein B7Z40_18510 [Bosea sp. 12-68-7]|nr:MAG: hypothetical protein B7Z40_18510 [Bosea sp. 12-68-7]